MGVRRRGWQITAEWLLTPQSPRMQRGKAERLTIHARNLCRVAERGTSRSERPRGARAHLHRGMKNRGSTRRRTRARRLRRCESAHRRGSQPLPRLQTSLRWARRMHVRCQLQIVWGVLRSIRRVVGMPVLPNFPGGCRVPRAVS